MGYKHSYDCGTIAIAASATASTALAADPHFQNASALVIEAPDALTGTITLQGSFDGASSYSDITSGGSDVTIGASESVTLTNLGWTHVRANSGSAEAAIRTFTIRAVEEVG